MSREYDRRGTVVPGVLAAGNSQRDLHVSSKTLLLQDMLLNILHNPADILDLPIMTKIREIAYQIITYTFNRERYRDEE